MMKIDNDILCAVESDLGLNTQISKGQLYPIRNCWHYSTDGNQVDYLFIDDEDFIAGINRLYVTTTKYKVLLLAFSLMTTHIHLIIWGDFHESERFIFEYLKLTSMYLCMKYGDKHKLIKLIPQHQKIGNDRYLKISICYVLKNAPVGGIPFNALDYPWSSGPLYFRKEGYWSSCNWEYILADSSQYGNHELRKILKTRNVPNERFKLIGSMVFPKEFVAVEIVERIFRTHKAFNYFMCISKESDVESVQGSISRLSIPYSELHQHKDELCRERFGVKTIRTLSTDQRLSLAKTLLSKYNCSPKQVAKACGLKYEEAKEFL